MKLVEKYILENYNEYDDRVKLFLSRVFEDVKKSNDEKLSNYFYCCLDLLAHQLSLYYLSVDAIEEAKNLSSEDAYKRVSKNPAVAIMAKAHQQILDILEKLSLSPFQKAKLKKLNETSDDESAEQLLKELTE